MVVRKPGRYLAPVALVAVAVAVGLIVNARVQTTHHAVIAPPIHHVADTAHQQKPGRRFYYVVKPGDSLSTISVKTGVPIATLEALNPSVNPGALQAGERLRLRR
jgi:spore germination protein YaaH